MSGWEIFGKAMLWIAYLSIIVAIGIAADGEEFGSGVIPVWFVVATIGFCVWILAPAGVFG